MTSDLARDFAAAGGAAHEPGVFQVERIDKRCQIVCLGIHVAAVPRLDRPAMATPVMGDTAKPVGGQNISWSAQASELDGQPWLQTTGWPAPQSL